MKLSEVIHSLRRPPSNPGGRFTRGNSGNPSTCRLRFEQLEHRFLLSSDLFLSVRPDDRASPVINDHVRPVEMAQLPLGRGAHGQSDRWGAPRDKPAPGTMDLSPFHHAGERIQDSNQPPIGADSKASRETFSSPALENLASSLGQPRSQPQQPNLLLVVATDRTPSNSSVQPPAGSGGAGLSRANELLANDSAILAPGLSRPGTAPLISLPIAENSASNSESSYPVSIGTDGGLTLAHRTSQEVDNWPSVSEPANPNDLRFDSRLPANIFEREVHPQDDALLNLFPFSSETSRSQTHSGDENWRIEPHVLRTLRDAADPAREHGAELHDATIAAWFSGDRGLIDLPGQRTNSPFITEVMDQLVQVRLQATSGVHRQIQLASLASLPAVQIDQALIEIVDRFSHQRPSATEEASPISNFQRLTRLAYPGVAIIASGLVMAVRYRRRPVREPSRS